MDSIIDTVTSKLKKEILSELAREKINGIKEILHHEAGAKRYASAMFYAANELGKIDAIKNDFSMIASTLISDRDISSFFNSNFIEGSVKAKILENVYGKYFQEETFNLLHILLERELTRLLPGIVVEYDNICNEYYNVAYVKIISAVKIKDIDSIKKAAMRIAGKDIELLLEIDDSLIAGIIVEIEDVVYDYSLRRMLDSLKNSISDVSAS